MKNYIRLTAVSLSLCILSLAPLAAQVNTSAIAGVVTDESGSVVPGAAITITQVETGLTRKTVSTEAGEYVAPQLPPGRYEVSAQATGFQRATVKDVVLAIAQRERINITMRVGQVAEEVTVSGQASQLSEYETASLGQLIERRIIQDLPLNGRNYLTLGSLSPGVVPAIPPSQGPASFIGATTQRPDRSILVGGQRESSTSYLLDGVELRNPRVGDTSLNPSLDSIQEFKIQRNFFQAEFGNAPGIINVATKSGTNHWHGSVYELLRNDRMDARNFFATRAEPFKRNQFGASAGGPVMKDKLFLLGSYEGLRQRLGQVQRGLFPTQKLLGGDFSGEALIYDPLTFNAAAGTRQVFAGNQVPAPRMNAVSRKLLPYIPVTNNPTVQGANVVGTPVQKLTDDQDSVRVDWLISARHSLFFRQTWQDAPLDPAALVPYGGRQVISKGKNEVAQLTSTLTPTVVNVLRIYHSYANLFSQQVKVPSNIGADVGITGISSVERNWGVPGVGWAGFSSIGSDGLTQGGILNNYNVTDSLALVKGKHSPKFGIDIRQSRMFLDSDNSIRGSFTFLSSWTAALNPQTGNPVVGSGHPVADFLLGYPTNMIGAVGTSQTHFRFYTYNLYAQDDWKPTRELTINYGLRYEYISPPVAEEQGNVFGFDFKTGRQLFPSIGQIRDSIIEPDHRDFAPRLGLAYNPAWGPSWVIRAGAGIYFDQTQMNEVQFTTNSPPTFFQQNINLTGRGLPPNQFGVNTLPVVPLPPISKDYQIPVGTALFAQELDGRKPRAYMYNFSVQKSIGTNWLAEAAYIGSQGKRLYKRYNADGPARPGVLYRVVPEQRLFPGLGSILYSSQAGKSSFHAMNLKLERRFGNGFSILSAYGWSHSIDDDSGGSFGTPNLNPANFQLDIGSSDFDIRQRFVTNFIYELPFGKGKKLLAGASGVLNQIVGGWQLNTITAFQSGVNRNVTAPNTSTVARITQRADATGLSPGSEFTLGGTTIRPGRDFGSTNRSLYWFNPNAFSRPAPLTFGTSGRDILSAPGFWNWDISLFKSFHFTERHMLQFRAEFFNALNQVRFNPPQMDAASPFFGQIQDAQPPRILQMGLRFQF
ncbi:MAG: TonB-dependent receptor [Candidatus Solibacter usitatus]|nr:TonB-dependent receptor [Candidatus Solibacter usitatus]